MERGRWSGSVPGMYQVRIHGRGGQGVVTAAELLSIAAFDEGRHAQAFPTFGSERTGAPVVSFCRISERPIRVREPIFEPDALIVQDPTLLRMPGLLDGLRPGGVALVNTARAAGELGLDLDATVLTVPASAIAREHLGRPMPNAALLGGLSALEGVVGLDALAAAIREKFPGAVAEGNVAAARAARDHVLAELREGIAC
jgi:pyruvate ferredoxin oxidoreductase gamma subunit